MPNIDGDLLRRTAPRVSGAKGQSQARIIGALNPALAATLWKYEIDAELRIAHFVAQICHESDSFCITVEYSDGKYLEGRRDLGNTQPGDGPRYKGRGLIQLTGRANYKRYGDLLGLDLVGNPELAAEPATSLVIACEYWKQRGLNAPADQDDIETITRRINGGLNGLEDRRACLQRAKAALGVAGSAESSAGVKPTLRLGSSGEQVAALQAMLVAMGFGITCDGDFGPGTAAAVKKFQTSHGLASDGVVGAATWNALAEES
jgi:putative chitinase